MATLNAVFKIDNIYNIQMEKIIKLTTVAEKKILDTSKTTNKMNDELSEVEGSSKGLGKLVKEFDKLAAIKLVATKGFELFKSGLSMSTEFQKSEAIFGGILGDLNQGSALFNHINKQAKKSSLSVEDMATNTQQFLGVTRNVDQLDRMNNMAERMTRLNTTDQDATSAGSALKQVMSGDDESIAESFNVSRDSINSSGLMDAVNTGDMTKALDIMDELLDMSGYSQEALDASTENASTQWNMFTSSLQNDFGMAMSTVSDTLTPVTMKLNELLESGKLQPFIDTLVFGFNIIAHLISDIANLFIELGNIINDNLGIVLPVLEAIAIYFLPTILGFLWGQVTALLADAAAWLVVLQPILLIIGAIAIVLWILQKLGIGGEQICGFIGGLFGVLYARIYNGIAYIYNAFASFAEFFMNVFNNPVAAVQKLFYDLSINVLNFMLKIAEGIESIVKHILPRFEVSITGGLTNLRDNLQDHSDELTKENAFKTIDRMEMKDYDDSFSKGYKLASSAYSSAEDKITGALGSLFPDNNNEIYDLVDNGAMPITNKDGDGSLDVSVNNEDIKYLKDIAERDYIANYSTATLAPNVQISFGDVKESADVDEVARRIGIIIKDELAVIAEG